MEVIALKVTKESRQLILFMSFGDGYLGGKYLSILHSKAQHDYLQWKRNLLIRNGIKCSPIRYKNNNGFDVYEFTTKSYNFISLYRKILYKPRKTIANRELLNKLTPLGIAIWYMDDGGLSKKKRNGVIHANDLMLNTHLTREENQIIIDYFKEVWDIQFTQVKNRGKYRLRCGTREARKFINIVAPFVSQIPSMKHKIDIKK